MPKHNRRISIQGKSAKEIYDRVSKEIDPFLVKAQLGKYSLNRVPSDFVIEIESSFANGRIRCEQDTFLLEINLSLLAYPFKSKLDESLDRWIAKTFPA